MSPAPCGSIVIVSIFVRSSRHSRSSGVISRIVLEITSASLRVASGNLFENPKAWGIASRSTDIVPEGPRFFTNSTSGTSFELSHFFSFTNTLSSFSVFFGGGVVKVKGGS